MTDRPQGSLDHRTQLVSEPQGHDGRRVPYVVTTIYPSCGEAITCLVVPQTVVDIDERRCTFAEGTPEVHWERANRRARARSRRYITGNRLRFMWVLTWPGAGLHGPDGRQEAMRAVAALVRKLRVEHGLGAYWYSPELHPDGHGWHVNLFVGRYLRHEAMARAWSGGYVWAKDWVRDSRVAGRPFLERLRAGARYGAKYASKDWDAEQLAGGAHRYEVAEGFDPPAVVAETTTVAQGLAVAIDYLGDGGHVWRSSDDPDWDGPPCAAYFAGSTPHPP